MKKTRVLLIEDNRLLRDGLLGLLNGQPDVKVVASLGNPYRWVKIRKLKPDMVLLDMSLAELDNLLLVNLFRKKMPGAKVVVMGLLLPEAEIIEFIKAGVAGFILKEATVDEFLRTVRTVSQGGFVLPPSLNGSLFSGIVRYAVRKNTRNLVASVRMTKREREIVD